MASFKNDYSYLVHPRILEAIKRFEDENHVAYGLDEHSKRAGMYIKKVFNCLDASVHFLMGGTQTNMTLITYCLRNYEGVISAASGHINVHESASIEGNGHKIIIAPDRDGKLYPEDIKKVIDSLNDEHMVKPRMIYISNSTEIGSIYTKEELINLYDFAKKNNLYLFIDGARIGSALTSNINDVEPSLIGQICDAFYVGGTKNGLLCGEALVIINKELQKDFRYHIKNKGAMLAKGYMIGIQFEEAFKDGLYFEMAKNTNLMADSLRNVLSKHNIDILPYQTNQVFAITDKRLGKLLIKEFDLEKWSEDENKMIVRFVTSFKTSQSDIDEVDSFLNNYK